MILGYESGSTAILHAQMTARGPVSASIIGTDGRIEFESMWFANPRFNRYAGDELVERFEVEVEGGGMRFQAAELERLVAGGVLSGDIMPTSQSVAIMETLDEVRAQIGLTF